MPVATHGGVVGEGPAEEQRTTLENINLNFPAFFLAARKGGSGEERQKGKEGGKKEARKDNNVGHRHTAHTATGEKKERKNPL